MQSETKQEKFNNLIETTLKNLGNLIDVNTVVGTPIKYDNGEYVIPISKVTIGVLTGGGEYGKLGIFKKGSDLPYSAGNGAIISIKPYGFLINDVNDNFKLLSTSDTSYEKIIDKATEFLSEIKNEEK